MSVIKCICISIMCAMCCVLVMCKKSDDAIPAKPLSVETTNSGATLRVSTPNCAIRVGEPLQVVVTVDRAADTTVKMPNFSKNIGKFEVRANQTLPKDPAFADRISEQVTLVAFESGELEVPPFEVTIQDAQGKESLLKSAPLSIAVQSRLEGEFNPKSFRDIKGAVNIPLETQWAWIIGSVILILILGFGLYRWWFHQPVVPMLVEAPHVLALRALDELNAKQLPQKGLVLDFYVQLSDTVRHYVEGRFGLSAPEQTTKEFLAAARHHPHIGEDHQRLLASFLRSADLVKFAAQRPGPNECAHGLDAARGFVHESAPIASQIVSNQTSLATQEVRA